MDMNDSRPTDRFSRSLPAQGPWYPPPTDPAYAEQAPYSQAYGGQAPPWAPNPNDANTTRQLPTYWQQDLPPSGDLPSPGTGSAPPGGPKHPPRWLWIVAAAAVLLVVALVTALVLVNDAIKTQTAVPPLPAMPETTTTMPSPSPRTSSPRLPAPVPPSAGTPTESTGPAAMQDIVYSVAGDGRAISIMYVDSGDVIQTEFNVALPWTKEVSLSKSAVHPANVTIVNIGHNVTCSVTIDGVQMSKRVGVGLTICDSRG
ncbi:MmpS family transport accessory protein [Mycobacterium sp. ACS4054]|uniref:MmpS family transport accessory protein n=1 Tax=Mycobacterium sp. ACS4054 TaxID=1834119 RepID=UPI001E2F9F6D|nr:MmpS family transport accessory protein [Mycobacterium sp. ACS4054]